VILGFTSMAQRDLPANSPVQQRLVQVLRAAERAAQLTRQLLAFGRKQLLAPKVIDLNRILADVQSMLQRLIREDIVLDPRPAESLRLVTADPGQLEQVIMNLVVNARDAIVGSGRITLETQNVTLVTPLTAIPESVPAGSYVSLAVTDTGSGIPTEIQQRLFEPFFTTKEPGKGTGLGLATVYGIVKQSGGHITLRSQPGQGATFTLYLPVAEPPQGAVGTSASAPGQATHGNRETILLVEDDPAILGMLEHLLRSRNYRVIAAGDGEEGLHRAMTYEGTIDLVISDVIMPSLSGPDMIRHLRQRHFDLRVVFISGYVGSVLNAEELAELGATVLPKPIHPDTFLTHVRTLLDNNP